MDRSWDSRDFQMTLENCFKPYIHGSWMWSHKEALVMKWTFKSSTSTFFSFTCLKRFKLDNLVFLKKVKYFCYIFIFCLMALYFFGSSVDWDLSCFYMATIMSLKAFISIKFYDVYPRLENWILTIFVHWGKTISLWLK